MQNPRILPISQTPNNELSKTLNSPLQLTDSDRGESHHDRDYWHARRVFLRSYHFSDPDDNLKEKLSRSVKEFSKGAMGAVLEIRREISKRRLGSKVFRFRVALPSLVFVQKCFSPWCTKT